MRIFFLIVCFFIFHNTHAQHRLGVGVNAGILSYSIQKDDSFGAITTKMATNPLANIEIQWEFIPTFSLQVVASLSQFGHSLDFQRNGAINQTGGSVVNSQMLGLNLKKRFWSFSTRILPKVDEIVLSTSIGIAYTQFKRKLNARKSNSWDTVLTDTSTDLLGSQSLHFRAGKFPLYIEYENLYKRYNFYGQIGLEISFIIRKFSFNYHFFYNLGLNKFHTSVIEYKYYQEPIQKASLKYNGTGIGGTFGIRYHFK